MATPGRACEGEASSALPSSCCAACASVATTTAWKPGLWASAPGRLSNGQQCRHGCVRGLFGGKGGAGSTGHCSLVMTGRMQAGAQPGAVACHAGRTSLAGRPTLESTEEPSSKPTTTWPSGSKVTASTRQPASAHLPGLDSRAGGCKAHAPGARKASMAAHGRQEGMACQAGKAARQGSTPLQAALWGSHLLEQDPSARCRQATGAGGEAAHHTLDVMPGRPGKAPSHGCSCLQAVRQAICWGRSPTPAAGRPLAPLARLPISQLM